VYTCAAVPGERSTPQVGDKVQVTAGERIGDRGVVTELRDGAVTVRFTDETVESVGTGSIRNFSLAARRAWKTRPNRGVGRPRTSERRKRPVTLRLEAELWDALALAVNAGKIRTREEAVNDWIRAGLIDLAGAERGSNADPI